MAIKTFNTRIQLKYDTYENWIAQDPVLLLGEAAVTTVSVVQDGKVNSVPSTLIKFGDGTHKYSELNYASGLSADVYSWAKAATKPEYQASEITNLNSYIEDYVNNDMGISIDTDTQYTITKVTDYQYKLMSKDKATESFTTEVAVIDLPNDTAAIEALQGLVGDTAVATQISNAIAALDLANTYEAKGEAAKVQGNLDSYKGTNDAAVSANTGAIAGIKNGTTINSFKQVEDADYASKTEAQGYADAKDITISEAKKAGTDAQADVDALEAKVGTVAEGITVVQMIADAQDAATYDDTALSGRVTTAEGKLTTLIGTDTDKSVRTIANEELAAQLIPENASESLDTLKEIADWIQAHPNDASAMNTAIEALESKVGDTEVSAQITAAIDALKIGDYAKAVDLTAAVGRITTAEGAIDALEGRMTTAEDAIDAVETSIAGLHVIATSGNVNDLEQTTGDYIIFNCGTSTEVI